MSIKQIVTFGLGFFGLTMTLASHAQVMTEAKIYICTDKDGHVMLQNLNLQTNCMTRVVKVNALSVTPRVSPSNYSNAMPDPRPVSGAMLVGAQVSPVVQQGRDDGRLRILLGELYLASQRLMSLQTEKNNSGSARLDNDLKKNLTEAQANVNSLKREIANVRGMKE